MLKTVLESLDGVDDAVKSLYAETDGKFVLQIEGVNAHPEVVNLKSAYERVKADLSGAKARLADAEKRVAPEDFDAEAWKAIKDGKPDAEAEARAQQQLVALRKTLEGERDEWKSKHDNLVNEFRVSRVNGELADAIAKVGVTTPEFAQAARAVLSPQIKLNGDIAEFDTDMGPMSIGDYVKRWAANEGKVFVSPPKGDGASGSSQSPSTPAAKGDFGGSRAERAAAIAAKFPDLANI